MLGEPQAATTDLSGVRQGRTGIGSKACSAVAYLDDEGGVTAGDGHGGAAAAVQDRVGGNFAEGDGEPVDPVAGQADVRRGNSEQSPCPGKVVRPEHRHGGDHGEMMLSVHGLVHVFLTPTHFNEGEPNRLTPVADTAGRYRVFGQGLVPAQPERRFSVAVSVSTAGQDGLATVTVTGALDLAAAEIVTRAIDQEITASGAKALHIDLSRTEFIDSSGISILLKGRRAADRTGVAYRVTGAAGMVRQILSLTGVLEHLTAEPIADPPG